MSSTGKVFFSDIDTLHSFQATESTRAPTVEKTNFPDDEDVIGMTTYRSTHADYLFVNDYGIHVYDEEFQYRGRIDCSIRNEGPIALLQTSSPDFPWGALAVRLDGSDVESGYDTFPEEDYDDAPGVAIGSLGDALWSLGIEPNTEFTPRDISCDPCYKPICRSCNGNGFCPHDEDNGRLAAEDRLCQCLPGYTGQDCEETMCQDDCSEHGSCVGPNMCECQEGWTGPLCSILAVTPKSEIDTTDSDGNSPAIWVSSSSPNQSRIITTSKSEKSAGINVFDLQGTLLQHTPAKSPTMLNVIYDFKAGNRTVDILFTDGLIRGALWYNPDRNSELMICQLLICAAACSKSIQQVFSSLWNIHGLTMMGNSSWKIFIRPRKTTP